MDLDAMKTFERAQFIEHQNVRRIEAVKSLESSMEKVRKGKERKGKEREGTMATQQKKNIGLPTVLR